MSWLWLIIPAIWFLLHILMHESASQRPYAVSHRGAGNLAPENTLAGIQTALDLGMTCIEIDVQRSKDGRLVVFHDLKADRITSGKGWIKEMTWEQLASLDPGRRFDPSFTGERIPTLGAVLEYIAGKTVTLLLEAKLPEIYPGIERQIADALQQSPAQHQVIVVSFNHNWLRRFHELAPDIMLGRIWVWAYDAPPLPQSRVTSVFWLGVVVDPTLVRRIHRAGDQVIIWTIDEVWLMRLMLWMGVDGITTNRPDRWAQVIGRTSAAY